jgi:hypothetical protein
MSDDADKCPMMILEVEVARHTGTTYEQVAEGLHIAGVMKHVDIILDPDDATPEQVERLQSELMGYLIHSDIELREETYDDLKKRLVEVETLLKLSKDAQQMERVRRFARRMLVLLDVVDELTGPQRKMAREVGSEMARSARNEVEAFLKADQEKT